MKKLIVFLFAIAFSISVQAQNYTDSLAKYEVYKNGTIDLSSMLQISAVYIGFYIKERQTGSDAWANRLSPDVLKPYVGSASDDDSVFNPPAMPAWYLTGMIEILLATANATSEADEDMIIDNNTNVPGYTSMTTQIVAKASGNGADKNQANYVLYYYQKRKQDLLAVRTEAKAGVYNWVNH